MNIFQKFLSLFKKAPKISVPPILPTFTVDRVPFIPEIPKPFLEAVLQVSGRDTLYQKALSFIGKDASPNDMAPDELGCADTVWCIIDAAFPGDAGFPHVISTTQLYRSLEGSDKYKKIVAEIALPGDIVISPTGYGNGMLANGHVGIKGEGEEILSNSSASGTFISNYTMTSWRKRYMQQGGFPMAFFRRK